MIELKQEHVEDIIVWRYKNKMGPAAALMLSPSVVVPKETKEYAEERGIKIIVDTVRRIYQNGINCGDYYLKPKKDDGFAP